MDILLNDIEVRVLGSLVEKAMTTPEYYPLTLNALTNACNQKSNRDPIMALEEAEVVRALDSLRQKGLAMQSAESSRVPRYGHALDTKLHLEPEELAVLCELLLRGAQTVGELRGRAERMHPLADLTETERVLADLAERQPPLVVKLPRQPGRKEHRFTHLLSGAPDLSSEAPTPAPEAARRQVTAENERIAAMAEEIAVLRADVAELQRLFAEFRAQFD